MKNAHGMLEPAHTRLYECLPYSFFNDIMLMAKNWPQWEIIKCDSFLFSGESSSKR